MTLAQLRAMIPVDKWMVSNDDLAERIEKHMGKRDTREGRLQDQAIYWAGIARQIECINRDWLHELDPEEELHPEDIDYRPEVQGGGTIRPAEPEELEYTIIGPAGWEISPSDLTNYQREVLDRRALAIATEPEAV